MKRLILIPLITIGLLLTAAAPQTKQHTATVRQNNGLYVFIECTPAGEYETLGTVKKTGLVMSGGAKELVKILTNRAKDQYPTCDAIIFDDLALDHATCIKLK